MPDVRRRLTVALAFGAVMVGLLWVAGCTSGRRTLSLAIPPDESGGAPPADLGTACVTSVEDRRVFQNKPPDPSTPSINGDVDDLTPDERARMIGRQRNKYGKAQGDIALHGDDSVLRQTRLLVETGLRRRGCRVVDDPGGAAVTVAVTIDRFWAWCIPAYWFTMFEARVRCTLTVTRDGRRRTVQVDGHGVNPGQVQADRNWEQAYERAYREFLEELVRRL